MCTGAACMAKGCGQTSVAAFLARFFGRPEQSCCRKVSAVLFESGGLFTARIFWSCSLCRQTLATCFSVACRTKKGLNPTRRPRIYNVYHRLFLHHVFARPHFSRRRVFLLCMRLQLCVSFNGRTVQLSLFTSSPENTPWVPTLRWLGCGTSASPNTEQEKFAEALRDPIWSAVLRSPSMKLYYSLDEYDGSQL